MKLHEEALYATYSILLKQGFELSTNYVVCSWGIIADILPMHQYGFTSIHFPHSMQGVPLGKFKTSILILSEEKALELKVTKKTFIKVMVGNIAFHLNKLSQNKNFLLTAGDDAALSAGDCGQLVSHNGPAVVLQLVID